jgi:hypothetical protein
MIGGGAGSAPATTTTGTGVLTALGVNVGSAGAFITFNGALGTPSSGTVTNLTGTASININGTVGATTANTGAFTNLSYTGTFTGGTGVIAIGTNQIYKDASGNVGIGTSSPSAQLNVSGAGQTTANLTDAGSKLGTIYAYSPNAGVGDGGAILLGAASSVGQTTPQWAIKALLVSGGVNGRGDLAFSRRVNTSDTALTEAMRIDSSGNVGIGTSSPTGKLDVAGTIKTLGYTVATLPTGVVGARAYVTNALAPTFGATVVTGGAVTIPVFYNGTNWIVG